VDKKTRTWVAVALGVLGAIVLLGIAAVGGTAYYIYSHVRQEPVAERQASDRLAQERARFAGQQPLIEVDERNEVVLHSPNAPPSGGARLRTLHVLVYNRKDGRLVDIDVPFWLLRMMPSGRISLRDRGINFDSDRLHITTADLERRGPGLVLDEQNLDGAQILIWTE
jgi:hypothetical protein